MAAEATPSSSDVEPRVEDSTSTTKRKADIDEIEVDLALPEPPSKRAKRALKKGKALPGKAANDNDNNDLEGEEKEGKKEKVRSEHSVWIGNLPFTVTAPQLRKWLVDNAGGVLTDESITRIKLPTSKEPGRDKQAKPANKGFAYIDFADVGGKVAAMALSENDLGGRKLLIKDATSFEGRPEKPKESAEAGAAADGKTPGKLDAKDANASRKVFVGNMSFKTTEDDLRRNFEKCGEIEWVKVATFEDTGKCKGFGWVKFKEAEAAAWAVKGFVKVKEQVETEDDFNDDNEGDEESKQKQFKTRKWWVNRMLGRELKLELAEDDQMRYKKRFGRDANKTPGDSRPPPRPRNNRQGRDDREPRSGGDDSEKAANQDMKPLKEAADLQAARLMGVVVKHTGTKMTFD